MFEPLTIRTCVGSPSAMSFRTQADVRDQRMTERLGLDNAPGPGSIRETGRPGSPRHRRQGTQGLEFADRVEPPRDSGPALSAPGIDPDRELRRPEPDRRERREELVAPCVEQVEQPGQPADPRRGGRPSVSSAAGAGARAASRTVRAPAARAAPRARPGRASAGRHPPGRRAPAGRWPR